MTNKRPNHQPDLEIAVKSMKNAQAAEEEARKMLYLEIKSAYKGGMTLQQIADVAGLTRMRISQIVRGDFAIQISSNDKARRKAAKSASE